MGKTQIGSSTISKKMFGNSEVVKEVLNGATVYEKGSGGGFSGTLSNTGYMAAFYYIDRMPANESDEGEGVLGEAAVTCQNYVYIAYRYYAEHSVDTYSGCTYEEYQYGVFSGYKVYPTQDGWTFSASFVD